MGVPVTDSMRDSRTVARTSWPRTGGPRTLEFGGAAGAAGDFRLDLWDARCGRDAGDWENP